VHFSAGRPPAPAARGLLIASEDSTESAMKTVTEWFRELEGWRAASDAAPAAGTASSRATAWMAATSSAPRSATAAPAQGCGVRRGDAACATPADRSASPKMRAARREW
jgi:hypothetical protein